MFTGIITGVGRIGALRALGDSGAHGKRVFVEAPAGYLDDVALGDSIALNGACMTVTALDTVQSHFSVDVSAESLARTCGLDAVGNRLNLEKALRAQDRLGGHIVSGHVDGVGKVVAFEPTGESWTLAIAVPADLARFMAVKGSVAVQGVSLTLNRVHDHPDGGCTISINLIPHTLAHTNLGELRVGARVNLEADTVARYVLRALATAERAPAQEAA